MSPRIAESIAAIASSWVVSFALHASFELIQAARQFFVGSEQLAQLHECTHDA